MKASKHDFRHLAGPMFLAVAAAAFNALAYRRQRPTISSGIQWVARRTHGDVLIGAIIGGLLFHWFMNGEQ